MKPRWPGLQGATRLTEVLQRALSPLLPDAAAPPLPLRPAGEGKPPLSATLPASLRDLVARFADGGLAPKAAPEGETSPPGARFLAGSFTNGAGTRPWRLYVPASYHAGTPAPLIVMLHGCTQSPEDFAAGTRMNEAAEKAGCLVLYPGQTAGANRQKCWNWFSAADQARGAGEPLLIAGMTRDVMATYAVDPARVFIAGLSAGGAQAAIMAETYPDLYAAIGVHSGLACGAARDIGSAFAAMQRGGEFRPQASAGHRMVPAIVFHGDRDSTVNARNADAVVAQFAQGKTLASRTDSGKSAGGRSWERISLADAQGRVLVESWTIRGAGHAWAGGSSAGSYTDPAGPDATGEMVRFFQAHSKEESGSF